MKLIELIELLACTDFEEKILRNNNFGTEHKMWRKCKDSLCNSLINTTWDKESIAVNHYQMLKIDFIYA